jgi:uncharacterized protein
MRDRCERCGTALAADSEAYICSYECTFCPRCNEQLGARCPNCDGELVRRPHRLAVVSTTESEAEAPAG